MKITKRIALSKKTLTTEQLNLVKGGDGAVPPPDMEANGIGTSPSGPEAPAWPKDNQGT